MKTLILVLAVLAGPGAAIAQVTPGSTYGLRGRGDIGPSNPSSGTATLDSLTVGFIDGGIVWLADGTAGAPSLSFSADPDVGLYRAGTNSIGLSTNGTVRATVDSTGITLFNAGSLVLPATGTVVAGNGGVGTPSITVVGDQNTGLYSIGADQLGVQTGGARSFNFSATAGVLEGITSVPKLVLDNTSGACVQYTGASVCSASNIVTVSASSGLALNSATPLVMNSVIIADPGAPSISSGFGTSPSVSAGVTTAAFRVNVGTGGSATSGVIALNATATAGWNCFCSDITTNSLTVFNCKQTASTTTTATIGQFSATTGVASAWVASDILAVSCFGY